MATTPPKPSEPTINRAMMTRRAYDKGRTHDKQPVTPRLLVVHATQGSYPGDYNWLRSGGAEDRPVSCHYYIDKRGKVTQFVDEADTAWHCGASTWTIDGMQRTNVNAYAIGIELENANNGKDPYPQAQIDALHWLAPQIVKRHSIPRSQVVRHLDISPGRKTDPAAFPWADFLQGLDTDRWALWGTAYPLDPAQREYGIPTLWYANAPWLGAATSDELRGDANTVVRFFAGGWITYEAASGTAHLGRRIKR